MEMLACNQRKSFQCMRASVDIVCTLGCPHAHNSIETRRATSLSKLECFAVKLPGPRVSIGLQMCAWQTSPTAMDHPASSVAGSRLAALHIHQSRLEHYVFRGLEA